MRQQLRLTSVGEELDLTSPYLVVTTRYRVLPRLEARGKTNFVGAARPCMLPTFLDLRVTRAKSPRSRQYILRSSAVASTSTALEISSKLHMYREKASTCYAVDRPVQLTRLNRRFTRARQVESDPAVLPELNRARLTFKRRALSGHFYARQVDYVSGVRQLRRRAFASRRTLFPVA